MKFSMFIILALLLSGSVAEAKLKTRSCGSLYGGLSFIFDSGVKGSDVAEKFESVPWAREIYETTNGREVRKASFYARLKGAPEYSYTTRASGVDVPVGSEEFLAEKLRATHLVHDIALPWGDCGGAEIAYFSLGKLKDQASLHEPVNFQNMIQHVSLEYARSRKVTGLASAGIIEMKGFTTFPIPPNFPVGRVRFRVASEISRDRKTSATWDQFDVVFSLWRLEDKDSLVTVAIEKYKNAPRAGRDTPPSSDYFREPIGQDSWDDELVISSSIAAYFSTYFKGKCVVDGEGMGDGDDGDPFSCK